jgi:inner membrane protein
VTLVVGLGWGQQINLATGLGFLGMVFLGGLAPDLDEPSSALWQRLPAGSGTILGKIVAPIFGSHRFISHSLVGWWLWGQIVGLVFGWVSTFVIVDFQVLWWGAMLGFGSHLVADALTREGVPLFWPLPMKLGLPPIKWMRPTTGGLIEKMIIFPGLLVLNCWWIYYKYPVFVEFFAGIRY